MCDICHNAVPYTNKNLLSLGVCTFIKFFKFVCLCVVNDCVTMLDVMSFAWVLQGFGVVYFVVLGGDLGGVDKDQEKRV